MNRYLCITPDARSAVVEADGLFLAEAVAAASLELDAMPRGSLMLRIGGAS